MLSSLPGGIFGAQHGHGEVEVLALHGWGRTHRDFDRVFERPQFEHRTAVAVDLPGFGATPLPPFAFTTRDYAESLVWGANDDAVSPAIAERAAAMLSQARLTVLSEIDHQTPRHAPAALAEAVERLA